MAVMGRGYQNRPIVDRNALAASAADVTVIGAITALAIEPRDGAAVADITVIGTWTALAIEPRAGFAAPEIAAVGTRTALAIEPRTGLALPDIGITGTRTAVAIEPRTGNAGADVNVAGTRTALAIKARTGTATTIAYFYGAGVSTSGRYLTDQTGNPWALRMISPWALMAWFTQAECVSYMQAIAALGFNSVGLNLVLNAGAGGGHTNADLKNGAGQAPFVGGDITNLTSTYWATVDAIVDAANAAGVTPILLPFGHSTGDHGGGAGANSFPAFAGKSNADCQTYGGLIATRMNGKRVMWMFGGDYVPITNAPWDGSDHDLRMRACLTGIRGAGHNEPFTVELTYNYSFPEQNQFWELEINGNSGPGFGCGYSYDASYAVVYEEYHWTTQANQWPGTRVRPATFIEGNYWGENIGGVTPGPDTTEETIRRQVLWPMTFGSPGWSYGDNNWDGQLGTGAWNDYLADAPPAQINEATDYFTGLTGWHLLVPNTSLVTSGAGTYRVGEVTEDVLDNDYTTAAITPDGSLATVYVPTNASASARAIVLNHALLGGNRTAVWYNPVTYATTSAGAGTTYTVPAAHADGTRDYLLVITADPITTVVTGTRTSLAVEARTGTALPDIGVAGTRTAAAIEPRTGAALPDVGVAGTRTSAAIEPRNGLVITATATGSAVTSTAVVVAAGQTNTSGAVALAASAVISAGGAADKPGSASPTVTAGITATGATDRATTATLAVVAAVTAAGVVTSGLSGGAALTVTATVASTTNTTTGTSASTATAASITAAGVAAGGTTATTSITAVVTAAGVSGATGSATTSVAATITAGGTAAAGSGTAAATVTAVITATGTVGTIGTAALVATATLLASAGAATSGTATTGVTASATAAGQIGTGAPAAMAVATTITATGVLAGGVGSAAVVAAVTITTTATMAAARSAARTTVAVITATGLLGNYEAFTGPVISVGPPHPDTGITVRGPSVVSRGTTP